MRRNDPLDVGGGVTLHPREDFVDIRRGSECWQTRAARSFVVGVQAAVPHMDCFGWASESVLGWWRHNVLTLGEGAVVDFAHVPMSNQPKVVRVGLSVFFAH